MNYMNLLWTTFNPVPTAVKILQAILYQPVLSVIRIKEVMNGRPG